MLTQVGYSLLLGSLGRSVQVVQLDEAVPIVPAVPSLRYGSLLIARRPVQKFNEYRAMGLEYAGAVVSTRSAPAGHGGQTVCGNIRMKLTAVSLPAKEGGYLLRGGNSRRDFEGETLAKANANLLDA